MERNFSTDYQLDWPEIVAQAKRRRKQIKLTQRRLAVVAGVSLPTVVKFEAGEDVRLSSALAILKVLDMVAEPLEGLLRLSTAAGGAAGPFQATFAPYGGSDGGVKPHFLAGRAALEGFLGELRIEKERQQQVIASLTGNYTAEIGGVKIAPAALRRYWPEQFSAAQK
jgi:transcriptional regulator with XRE-family HTH domain